MFHCKSNVTKYLNTKQLIDFTNLCYVKKYSSFDHKRKIIYLNVIINTIITNAKNKV